MTAKARCDFERTAKPCSADAGAAEALSLVRVATGEKESSDA